MDAITKLVLAAQWLAAVVIGDAVLVMQNALEWVALIGAAGGTLVIFYRKVWLPVYATATAAAAAGPALHQLEATVERIGASMDERVAHVEDRVRTLEQARPSEHPRRAGSG